MEENEVELDPTDLFLGLPGSPRKTETHDEGTKTADRLSGEAFEEKENKATSVAQGELQACSRLGRKDSEEGLGEGYRIHSPLVRSSKSLLMRKAASDVCDASPLTRFLHSGPVPVKRRRLPFSEQPKQKVNLDDCMSDGSTESGTLSGCESASIETDDEAGSRLESLQQEEVCATTSKDMNFPDTEDLSAKRDSTDSVNLDDSVSVVMSVPFTKLAMRQDSELFEDSSVDSKPTVKPLLSTSSDVEKVHDLDLQVQDHPLDHECPIKSAVERLSTRAVIGDGTVPFALPCIPGRHAGHKYITADTLAQLINGEFSEVVKHFVIIDCRYPYEYHGGHIRGATNMHCGDSVDEIMSWRMKDNDNFRSVLIFHCEFSSQRAPTMMRLLRSADRERNSHCYPYLCYPEIYLLSGGYKLFFQKYPELCEPQAYIPMNHRDHQDDLKLFRSRATTWHGEVKLKKHANSLIF